MSGMDVSISGSDVEELGIVGEINRGAKSLGAIKCRGRDSGA